MSISVEEATADLIRYCQEFVNDAIVATMKSDMGAAEKAAGHRRANHHQRMCWFLARLEVARDLHMVAVLNQSEEQASKTTSKKSTIPKAGTAADES